jgi:hypothetical protein
MNYLLWASLKTPQGIAQEREAFDEVHSSLTLVHIQQTLRKCPLVLL